MHPELHGLQRLRQRRLEPQQARPPVCQDTRQSGHRFAGLGGRNVRLRVIGSNDDMRARRDRLQPFDVHDLDRRLDERRDEVVGAAFREIRTSMTIQVTDRGVQAVRNFRHLAFDEIFLIERANAQGDVSLAAGEIETSRIVYQVDDNVRVPRAKSREQRSEDVVAEPGQTGHRDPALKTGITRGNAPLDRLCGLIHIIERLDQRRAERGRRQTAYGALKELRADAALQPIEPSADRGLSRVECSGR
jgi:hypothetical protein